MNRILWLTTADARGHLMRCQLVTRRLRGRGIDVDVVTTSRAGQAFLAAFGVDAALLSEHYRVEFDERQNMQRLRTEWRMFRYLTSPGRFWRDLAWLEEHARGARLVVNDSFHPALLLSRRLRPSTTLPPVVHVYGKHLRRAVEDNYDRRWPSPLERIYRSVIRRATDEAFGRIEHSLDAPPLGKEVSPGSYQVPPALAAPSRSVQETRRALGLPPGRRLVVAYLNPHFSDPVIAEAVEGAVGRAGYRLHAVGEGFAGRSGWLPWDTNLVDAIAASDVFISAPGVAALAQALSLGVPFLALVTDQPEQEGNLAWLTGSPHPHAVVRLASAGLLNRLQEAIAALSPSASGPPRRRAVSSLDAWVQVMEQLLVRAEDVVNHGKERRWRAA